jgi:putative transposase
VYPLSDHFRGRFLALARAALPNVSFPTTPDDKRWVVFAKPVARPSAVLDYLGRYVHRTALSDKAIIACDDRSVTFTYRRGLDGQRRTMTLPAHEFLRRFLQHVPLRGLHRVRAFGLLHPSQRSTLRRLQLLLSPSVREDHDAKPSERLPPRCPTCHQHALRRIRLLDAAECAAFVSNLPATAPFGALSRGPPVAPSGAPLP